MNNLVTAKSQKEIVLDPLLNILNLNRASCRGETEAKDLLKKNVAQRAKRKNIAVNHSYQQI